MAAVVRACMFMLCSMWRLVDNTLWLVYMCMYVCMYVCMFVCIYQVRATARDCVGAAAAAPAAAGGYYCSAQCQLRHGGARVRAPAGPWRRRSEAAAVAACLLYNDRDH